MSNNREMPIGLSFTMALNDKALNRYANMSDEEKDNVINQSRQVKSKAEMKQLVERIASDKFS